MENLCSGETSINRSGSAQALKIGKYFLNIYEGSPPQGPSRGNLMSGKTGNESRRESPRGGGGTYRKGGMGVSTPIIYFLA